MKQMILTLALFISIALPGTVLAHDASKHKGKPVQGEVSSLTSDGFELKTATGTIPVTFSSKTKFEHGNTIVDKTHVTKGGRVQVFGTKLPSGQLVAREVLIGGTSPQNGEHEGHSSATAPGRHAGHTKGKKTPAK